MAQKKRKAKTAAKKPIDSYEHKGKERTNNPQVGLVTPESDLATPRFMEEWVAAVNGHGGFGKWRAGVATGPSEIVDLVGRSS